MGGEGNNGGGNNWPFFTMKAKLFPGIMVTFANKSLLSMVFTVVGRLKYSVFGPLSDF